LIDKRVFVTGAGASRSGPARGRRCGEARELERLVFGDGDSTERRPVARSRG